MNLRWLLLTLAMGLSQVTPCSAEEEKPAATAQGIVIDWDALNRAVQPDLEKLELERLRFDAEMKKKRHEILEGKLKELMGQRVLEAEAAAKQTSAAELARMAGAEVESPSPEEIERVYEANKDRFKEPKEQILPKIETFLRQQKSRQAFVEYLQKLTEQYDAQYNLEPLRFEVGSQGYPTIGNSDAPITIVEFSDFQCPYCAQVGPALKRITEDYSGKVRLVFRQFPLTNIHQQAEIAAQAALCAADQGKFWEMHDAMFADQKSLSAEQLKEKAASLGLDADSFNTCVDSKRHLKEIESDVRAGVEVGVTGTPAFFINGRPLGGAQSYENIAAVIDEELESAGIGNQAQAN